jgi:hypothetical protein
MPKKNDVCKWSFKKSVSYLDYWCKSQIAIYDGEKWKDTYWGFDSTSNATVYPDRVEMQHLGNLDDYTACHEYDFDYYADSDCLNISHANLSRGHYLRKDAVKSVEKIRKVLESHLKSEESKMRQAQLRIESIKNKLSNVTVDSWI